MPDMIRISRRSVDALKPAGKPFTVWDSALSGFGVKVHPTGRKAYVLKYRISGGRGGKSREPVLGVDGKITPDAARQAAKAWLAKVALGEDPAEERRRVKAATMNELFDRYLEVHARKHKKARSIKADLSVLGTQLRPKFGKVAVPEMTRSRISEWHASLADRPYLANRGLALLSKVFNLAIVWGLWTEPTNPCRGIKRFKEEKRERFLSDEEFRRLFTVLDDAEAGRLRTKHGSRIWPYAVTAIRLLIHTGARSSEILTLRWDWVDMDLGRAILPDSKTGRRVLILSEAALEVLRATRRVQGNPHVIVGAKPGAHLVNLKDPWAVIQTAADIEDVRIHDLRHSYASMAAAGGMSLPQIGALLGHNSTQTTARYAHLADDVLQRSAAVISDRIASKTTARQS